MGSAKNPVRIAVVGHRQNGYRSFLRHQRSVHPMEIKHAACLASKLIFGTREAIPFCCRTLITKGICDLLWDQQKTLFESLSLHG